LLGCCHNKRHHTAAAAALARHSPVGAGLRKSVAKRLGKAVECSNSGKTSGFVAGKSVGCNANKPMFVHLHFYRIKGASNDDKQRLLVGKVELEFFLHLGLKSCIHSPAQDH